jgi:Na+/proline symporter
LFLLGGLFALFYIPTLIDGGFGAVIAKASAAGKLHWINALPPVGTSWLKFLLGAPFNLWMGLIGGTVVVLSSHGAEQLIVQRVLACKSVADGRKALVLSAVVIFPLFLIFLVVGAMLWVFYQGHPLQITLPEPRPGSGIKANDFIFPIFMVTEVPHVLKGFLIVAILSAAMSSVSSALTSLASVSTMDFVQRLWPQRSELFFLRFSRFSTVFWAAALVLIAYLSRQVEFVLNAAFSLRGLTSGALVGGLALSVFWSKRSPVSVVTSMLISLSVMTAIQVLPLWEVSRPLWMKTFGTEIFWPWYTLIGAIVTVGSAWLIDNCIGAKPNAHHSDYQTPAGTRSEAQRTKR